MLTAGRVVAVRFRWKKLVTEMEFEQVLTAAEREVKPHARRTA